MAESNRATRRFAIGMAYSIVGGLLGISAANAYDAEEVTDGASISGKVVYGGTVPTKHIIPSNPDTCGQPRDIALIETTDDGAVTDAVVYLEGIDRGKAWPSQPALPELDNRDCRFIPQLVVMQPGPIVIVNGDPVLHNTHSFYGRRTAFNIALPKKGLRIEKELRRPGIVRVECDEHGHMSARVFVAANPYYSATRNAGKFQISDIPPGEYKLIAYQEDTGPVETTIEVESGETVNLDIDLAKQDISRR